jgi:cytochrome c-type biogenesis protein CcmE
MSGAELDPDLAVIVHGRIIKWWLVRVKKIVSGYGGLKVFLDMGLVDLIWKIDYLTLSPEVKDEKNTRNCSGVRFGGCINSGGTRSEAREDRGY